MRIRLRRRHPPYDKLSRLADGELPAEETMKLNAHLAECKECREEVDFMVDLRARLSALSGGGPRPPPTLLPDILDRRLGATAKPEYEFDPAPMLARRVFRTAVPAAAALALLAAGFTLFGPGRVEAGASRLEFDRNGAGAPTHVRFSTAGQLAGESVVRMRGEYYDDVGYNWEESVPIPVQVDLQGGDAGRFEADLAFPTAPVYARVSIENLGGDKVEGGLESWEFLEQRADGEPTFRALMAKSRSEMSLDNQYRAIATVRRLTELYPDRPDAWGQRWFVEEQSSQAVSDRSRGLHQQRLSELLSQVTDGVTPDHLAALAAYASLLGDIQMQGSMVSRLIKVAPGHPYAAQTRVEKLMEQLLSQPEPLLKSLEAEWDTYGVLPPNVFGAVVQASMLTGDPAATLRWVDRWVAAYPAAHVAAVRFLGQLPTANDEVLDRLREAIAWVDGGGLVRPPGRSIPRHRAITDRLRRDLFRAIGKFHLQLGRTEEAYWSLIRADEAAWNPELFDTLARLETGRGDTDAAIRYRVLAAADPIASDEAVERQVEALRSLGVSGAELDARLAEIRPEVRRRILGGREALRLRRPVGVEARDGTPQDLKLELGSAATIIRFWSPYAPSTVEFGIVPLLVHCQDFAALGVRVLAVSRDPLEEAILPGSSLPSECGGGALWFYDVDRNAQADLHATVKLGEIVVLDAEATVRYRGTSLDDARRAAILLARAR